MNNKRFFYIIAILPWLGTFLICIFCLFLDVDEEQDVVFYEPAVKQEEALPTGVVSTIMRIRIDECGDKEFTFGEACEIFNKIKLYSEKHDISVRDALIIVNIESDFKTDAYNAYGEAYGLCQVTQSCLDEYNWNHYGVAGYVLEDMYDVDANLEVGFWYYNRILTHYSDYYGYITTSSPDKAIRDAYIAYNVGVTVFNKIGRDGRNMLRNGKFPANSYRYKKGYKYGPIFRFYRVLDNWSFCG